MDRDKWVTSEEQSQVVLLIAMENWVKGTELAFETLKTKKEALQDEFDRQQGDLTALIKLVQGELTKPLRTRIMCMITLDTAGRDKVEQLQIEKATKPSDFQWQKFLKP